MTENGIKEQVKQLIDENEILLFMKGTPEQPRCGFSMRVVQILTAMDVDYGAVDVLPALEPLREATGEISDWRTFPQLYVNGELLGGADIVEELYESGELAESLGAEPAETPPAAPAAVEPAAPAEPAQSPPLQIDNLPG